MSRVIYRYRFEPFVEAADIEASLLLAIWGCEALHGESQTRLDASHYFDAKGHACVIDAATPVGRDLNRLFAGFLRREYGEDAFTVQRIVGAPPAPASCATESPSAAVA